MEPIAPAVTTISTVVSIILLVRTARSLLRESRVSKLAPLVAIGAAVLTTWLYVIITGTSVNWWLAMVLAGLGIVIGFGEGRMTRMYYRDNTLIVKRSVGYLILWGLAYLLTVALDQLGNAALHAVGILIMAFGLGTAVGSNVVLLFRQMTARPAPAGASPVAPAASAISRPPHLYPVQPPNAAPGVYAPNSFGAATTLYPSPPVHAPPGFYQHLPFIMPRRRDSTCFVLSVIGVLLVLCSLLAVVALIWVGAQA